MEHTVRDTLRQQVRNRRILTAAAAVAGAVVLYKFYRAETITKTRGYWKKLLLALENYHKAFYCGSNLAADLESFLQKDTSRLPQSLEQAGKLVQFFTTAAVQGTLDGVGVGSQAAASSTADAQNHSRSASGLSTSLATQLLKGLSSQQGHSLISLAVGVATQNGVKTFVETMQHQQQSQGAPNLVHQLLDFVSSPQGERLWMRAVATFVERGVSTYCEKVEGINYWEELFASASRPAHKDTIEQLTRAVTREAVGTYLTPPRPSTQVRLEARFESNECGDNDNLRQGNGTAATKLPMGSVDMHAVAREDGEEEQYDCNAGLSDSSSTSSAATPQPAQSVFLKVLQIKGAPSLLLSAATTGLRAAVCELWERSQRLLIYLCLCIIFLMLGVVPLPLLFTVVGLFFGIMAINENAQVVRIPRQTSKAC